MRRREAIAALLVVLMAAGCGGGNTLPLVPTAGSCDRPPDPFWRNLSPLCGTRFQLDAVWTAQGTACVVGTGGLVLTKQGDGLFYPENPGTTNHLNSIAAAEDGTIIAVGASGVVAERTSSGWSSRLQAGADNLQTVIMDSGQGWAVGDGGTVIRRDAPGRWSVLDFPGEANLTGVASKQDTLAVSGAEGTLQLWADGQWTDLSTGPWQGAAVHSVAFLDDGRLVAVADVFYVRGSTGWEVLDPENINWYGTIQKAKYAAGRFWTSTVSALVLVDPAEEGWTYRGVFYGAHTAAGVRDANGALLIADDGDIAWYEEDGQTLERDPAGLGSFGLYHFADGSVGVFDRDGLLVPGPHGLERVLGFPEEFKADVGFPDCVTGYTMADFFVGDYRRVWRVVDGQPALVATLPVNNSLIDLELDDQGRLHLSTEDGVYSWDGVNLELTLPFDYSYPTLTRTRQGTVLARSGNATWYWTEAGWVPLTDLYPVAVGELAPGDLLFLTDGSDPSCLLRRMGVGLVAEGPFDPVPSCPGLSFLGGLDSPLGFYVYTAYQSLVFRLAGDPLLGNWDLVAGPLENEIKELEVLPDGTLLVRITESSNRLMIHPPAGGE